MRGVSLGRSRARWIAVLLFYGLLGLGYKFYYVSMPGRGPGKAEGKEEATVSDMLKCRSKLTFEKSGFSNSSRPTFAPGVAKVAGHNYTRTLVVGRKNSEEILWVRNLATREPFIPSAVYVVDGPIEPFVVPKNKGHEAMVYLTYIINHYHELSDVTIFMHAHLVAWHNNELLHGSASEMVRMLSLPKVVRDGYFNLRCHHDPGCPAHIRPGIDDDPEFKPQVKIFAQSWMELFPGEPLPDVVSQPCCAQFALSRERIQALPKERYEKIRRWILDTPLEDKLSGRVLEYSWQYIWTGKAQYCIKEHECYCDGFGICFGGEEEHQHYLELAKDLRRVRKEVAGIRDPKTGSTTVHMSAEEVMEAKKRILVVDAEMRNMKINAIERGKNPRSRAEQVGRPWHEADGF